MSLAARVAKLENIQIRALRCAWCRFALHSRVPTATGPAVECPDVLPTKCWYCGTKFVVPLRGLNGHQREIIALTYNSHPTKQFTDERVYAADIWFYLYPRHSEVKRYERSKQEQAKGGADGQAAWTRQSNSHTRVPLSSTEERAKRAREELKERAHRFHKVQTERFKKLAGGPDTFPLDQALEKIEKEYPTSGYDKTIDNFVESLGLEKYSTSTSRLRSALALCNIHLQNLKKREVCEIILWGKPLPETHEEISFFEQRKLDEIDNALGAGSICTTPLTPPATI